MSARHAAEIFTLAKRELDQAGKVELTGMLLLDLVDDGHRELAELVLMYVRHTQSIALAESAGSATTEPARPAARPPRRRTRRP